MKKILLFSLVTTLLVAACAAQPAQSPLSPEAQAVVATSVAMTMIAESNAAVPQNVPVNMAAITPFPTPLAVMVSAENPAYVPVQVSQGEARQDEALGSSDPCDKILNTIEAGPLSDVRFKNRTGGDVQLGIYLYKANSYGQCGYVLGNTIHIRKGGVETISLPEGDYFAWAWVSYRNGATSAPKGNFSIGYTVINQSSAGAPSTNVVTIKQLEISN